jgi:hydroxybutyrate-dimer hydrolase
MSVNNDDLLTGGAGLPGLGSSTPPGFKPSARRPPPRLRKLAIYTNYRALVDSSVNGGYGRSTDRTWT